MAPTHSETDLPIENQYPKLVHDRIPAMIERDGKAATTHIATEKEHVSYLLSKLIEEATELKEAEGIDRQKEEIADVREVLGSLQRALGFSEDEIREVQTRKSEERGGFEGRIINFG